MEKKQLLMSPSTIVSKLKLGKLLKTIRKKASAHEPQEETLPTISETDLSLKHIKDLIGEAFYAPDEMKKNQLLKEAKRLELQLIKNYKSQGLNSTAENIHNTLKTHNKRCRQESVT